MIRVVVRYQQHFAQNRLARPVRNPRMQIDFRILHHAPERHQIGAERFHALIPGGIVRRRLGRRPIARRPGRRNMFWFPYELENVRLRDAHVLQHFPRRVRQPARPDAAQRGWQAGHRGVEIQVRSAAAQQVDQVFPQRLILGHICYYSWPSGGRKTSPRRRACYHKRMRRLWLLCAFLPLSALAGERWIRFTSGPTEIFSSAGTKDGRETLVKFEEFRHALGQVLGNNDLQLPLPIRVLLFKTGAPQTPEPVVRGRDQYDVVLTAGQPIPNEVFARLTQLFLDTNTARMPERLERGLVALFSTIQVNGIRITLGEPPQHPDMDWARVHLLAVDPAYYGNLRVLTYNLRQGVDEDAAFRNAFGKSPEQRNRTWRRAISKLLPFHPWR